MPRRSILTASERDSLLALPAARDELIRHYTFSESDLALIRQHRGDANRLGFAVQLAYMRYPGIVPGPDEVLFPPLLKRVASQLNVPVDAWNGYGQRGQTRREHAAELQAIFGFKPFTLRQYRQAVHNIDDLACQTDKGIVLAAAVVQNLRNQLVLLPSLDAIERICAEAITRGNRRIYSALNEQLSPRHRIALDGLLKLRPGGKITMLAWLRQSPAAPNPKHMLEHLERLAALRALGLPDGIERQVHQNRLLKMAREGGHMTPADLAKFEPVRRYATLVAKATVIDEIVGLHDRIIGVLFNRARHSHEQEFQQSGKAINDKVRLFWRIGDALLEAKRTGADPFIAIESVLPWDEFAQSVTEARELAQSENFDYLHRLGDRYAQVRRYAPAFLDALQMKAAPAARELLDAVGVLKTLNADNARKVPNDAPIGFIKKRWAGLVFTGGGMERRFYELCVLAELKNALRSGDIWVQGSRQFKDFDEYLLTAGKFASLRQAGQLPLGVAADCERYLQDRAQVLKEQLEAVNRMAAANELPDATITCDGLKLGALASAVPEAAQSLMQQAYALLPHVKITELLMEVDAWTGFTRHFTHLKTGAAAGDTTLLLTAVLADGINLGLTKMAEACPGVTYARLSWLQAWHIRDETYSAALAELVNAHRRHPFAAWWGDGTTSSSDGQRFKAGGTAEAAGNVNPKYGSDPGVQFYTHISDQYAPFHTKVINVGVRDATYVLDGLLYHESDLRIEEHYTDTAGFTDHVFALMHLLGFRFAPRIRDLADKRLFVPGKQAEHPALAALFGGTINMKNIRAHWDEILRLASSIRQGTVTASLMLRKLGSYPRQNGLATALRELGRIERTLFMLDWLQNLDLRRRVNAGLNKGEARNALARAVFFNRLGEMRDRSFENQRYRAGGLTLLTAAIVLWNTVYLERAVQALRNHGYPVDNTLLQHLSPLGWEHINLTGDYVWRRNRGHKTEKLRPLRTFSAP
ncbi:MAG TPA: Tn3 family transposase [Pseudolabrys sp.]|nr:Tn3 family transposase [Pseudolabrys sp.]